MVFFYLCETKSFHMAFKGIGRGAVQSVYYMEKRKHRLTVKGCQRIVTLD